MEALHKSLKSALRQGARASRLLRYSPDLIELLCSEEDHPELTIYDRAIQAEDLIRTAIQRIGGDYGQAAEILFALKAGTLGLKLDERRRMAGALFEIDGDTFRRPRWEGQLVWDVAVEVYRAWLICDREQR